MWLPVEPFVPPLPSFPQPVEPPSVDPDEGEQTAVCFSVAWLPYVLGALRQLWQATTWRGTEAEVLLAQERSNLLMDMIANPVNCGTSGVPTPYWDTDTDVDDEAEPAEQAWYGYVEDAEAEPAELTFFENAAIWTFTGFIAAASVEVGFYPAILFHTVAPRFVLAMRRGDFGNVVRILVDGEEQARVDTSTLATDDILEVPVVAPGESSPHELMIVGMS